MIAVIAAGCLVACGLAGVKSFAKTGDSRYPEDAENAIDVSGGDEATPSWSPHATSDQAEEQQYLKGMSETPQGADSHGGSKVHGARDARASGKTASGASARAASNPGVGPIVWRRAFGPLVGWGIWFVLVAAAIAALAWITSLVVRRRSTEGVPPLVVFDPDGSVAAPSRREGERPRRAA